MVEFPPRLGLERLESWIDRQERSLRELVARPNLFIHVVGTNGKGSVCAGLAQRFRLCSGKKVALFTSPHLVDVSERLRINGRPQLLLNRLVPQIINQGLTFFEATVAAALLVIDDEQPDVVIWEAGLGGRLDGTNVIKNPWAVVLTRLGMDHQEYLGNSIELIAREKLAVAVKTNSPPVFTFSQQAPMASLIIEREVHAVPVSGYTQMNQDMADTVWRTLTNNTSETPEPFWGREIIWPGRNTWIKDNLLIDGAHNLQGVEHWLQQWGGHSWSRIGLAALRDKEPQQLIKAMAAQTLAKVDYVLINDRGDQRVLLPSEAKLVLECLPISRRGQVFSVDQFVSSCEAEGQYALLGSLYAVGEVYQAMNASPWCL